MNSLVKSPSLPLSDDVEAHAVVKSYADQITFVATGGKAYLPALPSKTERKQLQDFIGRQKVRHRPISESAAERDRAMKAVAGMFTGFTSLRNSNAAELCTAFLVVLSDLPLFAIEQACEDIARGRASSVDPDYPPTAPRMHQIADKYRIAAYERDIAPAVLVLGATQENIEPKVDREKVGKKFDKLLTAMGADADEERRALRAKVSAEVAERNRQRVRDEWAERGLEPPKGYPISYSLAKKLGYMASTSNWADE